MPSPGRRAPGDRSPGDRSPGDRRQAGHTPDRHFRAPDELYLPAAAKAEREGRTVSWVLRHALALYLAGKLPLPQESGPGENESPPPGGDGP